MRKAVGAPRGRSLGGSAFAMRHRALRQVHEFLIVLPEPRRAALHGRPVAVDGKRKRHQLQVDLGNRLQDAQGGGVRV